MDPATIALIGGLAGTLIKGIMEMAKANGATPEQLAQLRERIRAQSDESDARYDSAVAGAESRIAGH